MDDALEGMRPVIRTIGYGGVEDQNQHRPLLPFYRRRMPTATEISPTAGFNPRVGRRRPASARFLTNRAKVVPIQPLGPWIEMKGLIISEVETTTTTNGVEITAC